MYFKVILGRLELIVCCASKYFQNPMREGENTANTTEKAQAYFIVFFSVKSLKLYEGVDAKHTINFKRPYGKKSP